MINLLLLSTMANACPPDRISEFEEMWGPKTRAYCQAQETASMPLVKDFTCQDRQRLLAAVETETQSLATEACRCSQKQLDSRLENYRALYRRLGQDRLVQADGVQRKGCPAPKTKKAASCPPATRTPKPNQPLGHSRNNQLIQYCSTTPGYVSLTALRPDGNGGQSQITLWALERPVTVQSGGRNSAVVLVPAGAVFTAEVHGDLNSGLDFRWLPPARGE